MSAEEEELVLVVDFIAGSGCFGTGPGFRQLEVLYGICFCVREAAREEIVVGKK